jgi:thioesterase domain-containing protein
MSDTPTLSEAKRILLEKHLTGKHAQTALPAHAMPPETDAVGQRERAIMMQPGKSRRPFFYLPGDVAERTFYCYPLAHSLGEDQPFYLLEPYNFDGLPVPPSFEEMAAAHLKRMRTIQPEGPYLLGGWCNGGLVAYEMARQLYTQGQTVDLLVLMDADPPAKFERDYRLITTAGKLLRLNQKKRCEWFLQFRQLRLSIHFWFRKKLLRGKTTKQANYEQEQSEANDLSAQLNEVIVNNESSIRDWESIFDWMASAYKPCSFYSGTLTFFWTHEEPARQVKWRKWLETKMEVKELEIHIIPGNHITSRTDHLSSLAKQLRLCLDKAQKSF